MTIKEYVEGHQRMSINGWLAQIKKDDLEHMERKIITVADSLGMIKIDDMDFVTAFKRSITI